MRARKSSASPNRRSTTIHRGQGPSTGWRGGGPLCPLRWVLLRRSPTQWAAKNPESEMPNRPPSTRRAERIRKKRGGGADLCVRSAGYSSARPRPNGQPKIMDRPTTLPGDNRLSSRERHPSRPCPEGTFLDSPGFVRSTTLGCGPVQKISPEGAGLIGVLRETVGRIVTCFGSARSNATAVPNALCVKRTPLGFRCLLDVPHPG